MTAVQQVPQGQEAVIRAAFGYMRVPCDMTDAKAWRLESEIRRAARQRQVPLGQIYYEWTCGARDEFNSLLKRIVDMRAVQVHVLIPTARHLALNGFIQNSRIEDLRSISAVVVLLDEVD